MNTIIPPSVLASTSVPQTTSRLGPRPEQSFSEIAANPPVVKPLLSVKRCYLLCMESYQSALDVAVMWLSLA